MANRIQTRHGAGIPTTTGNNPQLLSYEQGWDTTNKILYINDNGTLFSLATTDFVNTAIANAIGNAIGGSY